MIVDISDVCGAIYFYGGDYEPSTTRVIRKLIRPGDVVCDVGANVGYFTFLTADLVGTEGHIHSFEPNPNLSKPFMDSMALNCYENRITFNQLAISDKTSETVEFYISAIARDSGLSSLRLHAYGLEHGFFSSDNKILVQTITLDDYFRRHRIERCALVKIDVETAESYVINGMRGLLQEGRLDFVICETAVNDEADRSLRDFGYAPYMIVDTGLQRVEADTKFWGNLLHVSPRVPAERSGTIQSLIPNGRTPNAAAEPK